MVPTTNISDLSPLTKQNISQIIDYLGVEFVLGATPEQLIKAFSEFNKNMVETGKSWNPPVSTVNGGAITGFRGNGIVTQDHQSLTDFGIMAFKGIAQEKAK
jgi:hypothetical protein